MAFKLGFKIGSDAWYSEMIPVEFVRVGRVPTSEATLTSDSGAWPVDPDRSDLEEGGLIITDGMWSWYSGTCSSEYFVR